MVSDQSITRHLSWKATRSLPPSSTHFLGVEGCHLRGWRNPKIVWLPLIKIKNDPCLMIGVTLKTRRYVILGFRGFSRRVWGSGLGTKRGRYIHCLWSGAKPLYGSNKLKTKPSHPVFTIHNTNHAGAPRDTFGSSSLEPKTDARCQRVKV